MIPASEMAQALKEADVIGRQIVDVFNRENEVRIVLDSGQTIVFFGHAQGVFVDDGKLPVAQDAQGWLAERLRIEQIVVGSSPLAQRVFSLVSDICTLSPHKCCFVSLSTLARTLAANRAMVGHARDELIKAGALRVSFARNEHSSNSPRRVLSLPCATRPINHDEPHETVKQLLKRVREENAPAAPATE